MLNIRNLHASVDGKAILKGLDLEVKDGEVHAIMGPNGSGKSTLAQVLAGRETYQVNEGSVEWDGADLLALPAEERARAGLFLAFQYPVEIPGVNNAYLLKAALNAVRKQRGQPELDAFEFLALVRDKAFPAARKNATKCCRWRCSSRVSRCSTRLTRASTSTPCASSPRGSTGCARRRVR